jgi:hypothetical protein
VLSSTKQLAKNQPITELLPLDDLRELLRQCCSEFNKESQIEAARDSAAAMVLDRKLIDKHFKMQMDVGGELEAYAKEVQDANSEQRFNIDRLAKFEGEIPPEDFQRLLDIASRGLTIPVPEDFRPAPPNPRQRTLTKQLGNIHVQHYMKSLQEGNCIAIDPTQVLPQQIATCAFMDHNWVGKRDAQGRPVPKGRVYLDPTNVERGDSLNDPSMREAWEEIFGHLKHPDIISFVQAIVNHADEHDFPLSHGSLWKDDVANAFGQMPLSLEAIRHAAIELHITEPLQRQSAGCPRKLYLFMLYCFFG